jgi:quinohemoprotein ethanol dehydrogenase
MNALNMARVAALFITLGLAVAACTPQPAAERKADGAKPPAAETPKGLPFRPIDAAAIKAADDHPGEWLTHGRSYSEQRYAPLKTINRSNVARLGLAWSVDFGTSRGIEATPIVANGILYVTGPWNVLYALEARSGALMWNYDPETDRSIGGSLCCDAVNRGVAVWGDKVYLATLDGRLVAIEARTGIEQWQVETVDRSKPYSITGAPRIINGKVIIGNGGGEYGVRGYVSAYDAETGALVWRFYTVPGDPSQPAEQPALEMARATWTGEWWKYGGGGTVWDSMAYDPDLDLLYIGVGNGAPWNQKIRSPGGGDNLFLSSIVALRPDTGEYVWHFQTTPGDTWDYTATQHMILADLEIDGEMRKVIMQAPKNGFFYVLDRETGAFISARNFVPVNWASGVDPQTGRPIEAPDARWPGKAPHLQLPGPMGAHNWQPMAFDPETGLVFIPAQEAPLLYGEDRNFRYASGRWNTGADLSLASFPTDEAAQKAIRAMLKGRLIAWDPVRQEARWSVEHQGPWNGGALATAGGLVFQGTADAHFVAYDSATGALLWKTPTQTGVMAAPVTYEIDGEQYVAVAAGWGGAYGLLVGGLLPTGSAPKVGRLLVYKLGGKAELPPLRPIETAEAPPPDVAATPETILAGAIAYAQQCAICHGDHALAYGTIPSLRHSPILADGEAWAEVVLNGSRAAAGMPAFNAALDPASVEAIRAYVADAARNGLKPISGGP